MGLRDLFPRHQDVMIYGAAEVYCTPLSPGAELALEHMLAKQETDRQQQLNDPQPLVEELVGKIALIHPQNLDADEFRAYRGVIRDLRMANRTLGFVLNSQFNKIHQAQQQVDNREQL